MKVSEVQGMIGAEYLLREGAFTIVVTLEDVKLSYGKARGLVQPVGGTGLAWVNLDRLRPHDSAGTFDMSDW